MTIFDYLAKFGNVVKTTIILIIIGIVIGISGTLTFQYYINKPTEIKDTVVTNLFGAALKVTKTQVTKKEVQVITIYDGSGSSQIDIPIEQIPQAHKWINYKWSINSYYLSDQTLMLGASYRIDRLTLSSGGFARINKTPCVGWWIGGSWAFQLGN